MVKKADLLNGKTQKPLQLRNTALLSLDGGGLRGILTGSCLVCMLSAKPDAMCKNSALVRGQVTALARLRLQLAYYTITAKAM